MCSSDNNAMSDLFVKIVVHTDAKMKGTGRLKLATGSASLQPVMNAGQSSLKFMKPDKEEATERVFQNV